MGKIYVEVKFSDALIKDYQENSAAYQLRDPAYSLRLRFSKSRDKASWFLVTFRDNKDIWQKVGTWPNLPFKQLKKIHSQLLSKKALNPSEQLDAHDFKTVADVLRWYQSRTEKLKTNKQNKKNNVRSVVNRHLLPRLGHLNLEALTHNSVDELLLLPLQESLSLATVRNAFVVLKTAFARAKKQRRIVTNPIADMIFSHWLDGDIKAREGAISSNMVSPILERLSYQPVRCQVLVCMLIAFATRLNETRLARWDQFDFNKRQWLIPAKNTKTSKAHSLPLSNQIIFLLTAYRQYQFKCGYQGVYLFPGAKNKAVLSSSTLSRWIKKLSQGDYSAHDFRKLARSVWADLNVDYMVGERLLNHAMSKLDEAYFQTLIKEPKRQAIEQYHDWLCGRGLDLFCNGFEGETIPRSFFIYKQAKAKQVAA